MIVNMYFKLNMIWNIIEDEARCMENKHPGLRKGQILYTVVAIHYPEIAEQLTATEYDCFNDDTKINSFKEKVTALLVKEHNLACQI